MQNLETGKDKIKKIIDVLKVETIEPAKEEAKQIVSRAEEEAKEIINAAYRKKDEILKLAKEEREREKELFETSLTLSFRQALAAFKQDIEENLFDKELGNWLEKVTSDPNVVKELVTALVQAIAKEGTSADFSAIIPKTVSPEKVNGIIGEEILKKLREKKVVVGEFFGGVQLKLHDRKVIFDLSDQALKDLLSKYLRKEFRNILFRENG